MYVYSVLLLSLLAADSDPDQFFEQQVRPLLAARCFECHGEKKQESSLRLDSRAAILAGGQSGEKAAVPGDPANSLLIKSVRHLGDYPMPPKPRAKLTDAEIESLASWIKLGLPWPNGPVAGPQSMADREREARAKHWAFQPLRPSSLGLRPERAGQLGTESQATRVDQFIQEKLAAKQLTPSPPADRRTLIRRLSFDLLGLPPTPAEVAEFVGDPSPDAYERLVDRLLASPRYGERWGRHWLDVARYADTRGYAFQNDRRYPYAYTYRDYVVRALNEDLPYDRFIVEQLAADRLSLGDRPWALAALGFLTTGRKFNNRHDDLDDQIDVVCRGLLGLTVACSRCHDHKYDAVPMDDYYSLYGVFASCNEPGQLPLLGDPESTLGYAGFKAELDKRKAKLETYLDERHVELLDKSRRLVGDYLVKIASNLSDPELDKLPFLTLRREELKPRLVERWRRYLGERAANDPLFGPWRELMAIPDGVFAAKSADVIAKSAATLHPLVRESLTQKPPGSKVELGRQYGQLLADVYAAWKKSGASGITAEQRPLLDVLLAPGTPTDIARAEINDYLNRAEGDQRRKLEREIAVHEAESPAAPPRAMVLQDNASPHEPHVFQRGNPNRPGKRVPRQFLSLLSGPDRRPFATGSGRLDLAQAIVNPNNPLTARVIANRIWMHHFGDPLVITPSDFGVRCDPPWQRELLDHLAWTLREAGWSLKALHREILLSATYRQASLDRTECRAVDPENRLLWRMNRRRLEFEPLRDSLLFVAGQLDLTIGGRAVELTTAPFARRRTVYGFLDRQDLPNLFRTFDIASPDSSAASRPRTTVPQQALFLMNSPFVVEQAKALLTRAELASSAATERIAALYRLLYGRDPTADEVAIGQRFLTAPETNETGAKLVGWEQYVQLLLLTNEFAYVD